MPKLIDQKRKHLEKNLSTAQQISCFSRKQKGKLPLDENYVIHLSNRMITFQKQWIVFKIVSQLGNGLCRSIDTLARAMYMSNQATQKQDVYPPNNLPNFHPTAPKNISQSVSFSWADSYASYAEWLNESQGKENWIIQKFLNMWCVAWFGTKRLKTAFEWLAKTPFELVRMRVNGLVRKAFLSIRLHDIHTLIWCLTIRMAYK